MSSVVEKGKIGIVKELENTKIVSICPDYNTCLWSCYDDDLILHFVLPYYN